MSGHWIFFFSSPRSSIKAILGYWLQSVGCNSFFHCNLTSQLVQNFLLHTNSFFLYHLLNFFLSSFLLGTLSRILIASVCFKHKLHFLLIHFSFPSPSSEMRETCVCVALAIRFLVLHMYRLSISYLHISPILTMKKLLCLAAL